MTFNKREGERAGIESSLSLLQEEHSIVKIENDDMNKTIMQNSRKLKDLQRENETLKLSLKIEREEMENMIIQNKVLSCAGSRSSTPQKIPRKTLSEYVIISIF